MNAEPVEKRADICNALSDVGCCKLCVSRFLGEVDPCNTCEKSIKENNHISLNEENETDEHAVKKMKVNPCVICLDLLQDITIQNMVSNGDLDKIMEYDCDTFVNYISFPVAILLREHSMEIYMKEKFPDIFIDQYIVPINRAWSIIMQKKLPARLNKKFDRNSNLIIHFTATYDLDKEELWALSNAEEKVKKINGKNDTMSRTAIGEFLKTMSSTRFQKYASVPPKLPVKSVLLDKIEFKHEPIFVAGRYCKYSRNLGQTPWVIDNVRIVESSVQEIIFACLESLFQCRNLVFSSSGREDFDVRTLGRGRPFFIKICDPKITQIHPDCFRAVEEKIKKTALIRVQDLQFIDKKYLTNIKEGEQFKRKTYTALCIIDKPENLDTYISKINNIQDLKLQQKTPIRVYHRRSSNVREKVIYDIKARSIPGKNNLFELVLVTQAGTYVKEFVHGDLGRTTPSLSEIIGGSVDIVALDVVDIHLDFPPPIDGNGSSN